jgi:glycoprotein endo-alpha-1,2-mannosidase
MGAYYYPWYASNGRHWSEGYIRGKLIHPQTPLLGEYDSRDEAIINQHISWAKDAGIDFFCMSYWGEDTFDNQVIKNHFLKASELEDFKFAILYETLSPSLLRPYLGLAVEGELKFEPDNAMEQAFVESFEYLAETYFNHPSYLRIDGKPVIVLYITHQFIGDYKGAIEKVRSTIRQKHNIELYLIGDEVDTSKPPREDRIACFDAITPYIQYVDVDQALTSSSLGYADETWVLQNARMKNTIFKEISDRLGIGFVPNALPSFNDRGVRLNADHYYLPLRRNAEDPRPYGLFEDYLQLAG